MYLVRFNCCRDFNFYCLIHYFKKLYNQDDISNDTFQNMGVTLWIIKFVLCATIWYESLNCFSNRFILGNCGIWNVSKGLPKTHTSFFLLRIKLMAEGELKDMEQFFDDLSDSFSGTEPEVHKTSVVGMKFF